MLTFPKENKRLIHISRFISTEELNFPCYISTFGKTLDEKNVLWNVTKYLLVYCESGQGFAKIGGVKHPLSAGSLLFCTPDDNTLYTRTGKDNLTTYWVTFQGSMCKTLLPFESCVLKGDDYSFIKDLAISLYENQDKSDWDDYCSVRLYEAILNIRRKQIISTAATNLSTKEKLEKSIKYLIEHYNEEISLNTLALIAGVGEEYYCRIFKKCNGVRPMTYLNSLRLRRACDLLASDKHKKIEEIAREVGYQNNQYFSKLFHKVIGITPSRYRKSPSNTLPVINDLKNI